MALVPALLLPATASAIFPPVLPTGSGTLPTGSGGTLPTGSGTLPTGGTTGDPVPPTVHKTPEPATYVTALIGIALVGAWALRRKRKELAPA
jgi:hypothetical protein